MIPAQWKESLPLPRKQLLVSTSLSCGYCCVDIQILCIFHIGYTRELSSTIIPYCIRIYFSSFATSLDNPRLSYVCPGGNGNPSTLCQCCVVMMYVPAYGERGCRWALNKRIMWTRVYRDLTMNICNSSRPSYAESWKRGNKRHKISTPISTHASENRTTRFSVGISAALATSLLVIALYFSVVVMFRLIMKLIEQQDLIY